MGSSLALQNSTLDTSGSGVLSFGTLTSASFGGLTGPGTISLAVPASYCIDASPADLKAHVLTLIFGLGILLGIIPLLLHEALTLPMIVAAVSAIATVLANPSTRAKSAPAPTAVLVSYRVPAMSTP